LIRSAYTALNGRHYIWPAPYLSNAVAPAHITMTASHKTVVKRPSTNLCTVGEKPTVQNMRSERPVSPRAG